MAYSHNEWDEYWDDAVLSTIKAMLDELQSLDASANRVDIQVREPSRLERLWQFCKQMFGYVKAKVESRRS